MRKKTRGPILCNSNEEEEDEGTWMAFIHDLPTRKDEEREIRE